MSAHSEIDKKCAQLNLTAATGSAGITTISAANATLDAKQLRDLLETARGAGFEVVLAAGAVKIRPKDSSL